MVHYWKHFGANTIEGKTQGEKTSERELATLFSLFIKGSKRNIHRGCSRAHVRKNKRNEQEIEMKQEHNMSYFLLKRYLQRTTGGKGQVWPNRVNFLSVETI